MKCIQRRNRSEAGCILRKGTYEEGWESMRNIAGGKGWHKAAVNTHAGCACAESSRPSVYSSHRKCSALPMKAVQLLPQSHLL